MSTSSQHKAVHKPPPSYDPNIVEVKSKVRSERRLLYVGFSGEQKCFTTCTVVYDYTGVNHKICQKVSVWIASLPQL